MFLVKRFIVVKYLDPFCDYELKVCQRKKLTYKVKY